MTDILDKEGNKLFWMSEEQVMLYDRVKKKINEEDKDVLAIFCGETGSGKSLAAMKAAYYVDPHFNIDQICLDRKEFINAIIDSPKHRAIIGDEAITLFFNREILTQENRIIIRLMEQIRQKNLFIILCVPNLLNIDSMIISKAKFISYVWESQERNAVRKGNQAIFIDSARRRNKTRYYNYLNMKRKFPYKKIKIPSWDIRVPGNSINGNAGYPISESDYRDKKEEILKKYKEKNQEGGTQLLKYKERVDKLVYDTWIRENKPNPHKLGEIIDIPQRTIADILRRKGVTEEEFDGMKAKRDDRVDKLVYNSWIRENKPNPYQLSKIIDIPARTIRKSLEKMGVPKGAWYDDSGTTRG